MTSERLFILIREERIPDLVGDDGEMLVGDDREMMVGDDGEMLVRDDGEMLVRDDGEMMVGSITKDTGQYLSISSGISKRGSCLLSHLVGQYHRRKRA